ncbi:MAG: hypothetical protein HN704_11530 [Bacteroidetes bacterium]|jgi:hypothetical protein|nr:hypothetical protein [Bacteroidota bacterium]MBT6685703.1 hypothetical protein [Bacteroidota bacterium]MBT7143498.1 hypothetical protein [Bacteroidota bacterium]MBT7492223.1 hypothetical protein [Bacteroidota bacterium]
MRRIFLVIAISIYFMSFSYSETKIDSLTVNLLTVQANEKNPNFVKIIREYMNFDLEKEKEYSNMININSETISNLKNVFSFIDSSFIWLFPASAQRLVYSTTHFGHPYLSIPKF